MTFIVLILFISYVAFAIFFILSTWKTSSRLQRQLTVAFFVLLPTWDAVLGYIVYYPACLFVPKTAIYETAETEGIYYEGIDDYLKTQQSREGSEYKLVANTGWIAEGIKKGFKYVEYASSDDKTKKFECVKLEKDNKINVYASAICVTINSVKSKYEVKISTIKIGTSEINLKNIYDRNTGKLMAEYHRATRWPYAGLVIPFFNWLDWGWGSKEIGSAHCPPSVRDYESFEYEVLKPKK